MTLRAGIWRSVRIVRAILCALFLIAGAEAARIGLGANLNTVAAGRCYRCAQPSPRDLRCYAERFGIRSIINLRGYDEHAWYSTERDTAQSLGMQFVDAGLWASTQPTEAEFLDIVRSIDESPEPILLHCESGIDRSGLGAALFLLLKTDASLDEARRQLSVSFGHFASGRAGCLDRILDSYAGWLTTHGTCHRPERFREWAGHYYRPESARPQAAAISSPLETR